MLAARPNEVDLHAGGGSPERELPADPGMGQVCSEFVKDPRFEQVTALRRFDRLANVARECTYNSRVEEIELGVLHLPDACALLPRWKPRTQQRVGKHLEVALHRHACGTGVATQSGNVDHLRVGQGGDAQEAPKGLKVLYRRLLLHLFTDVVAGVCLQ